MNPNRVALIAGMIIDWIAPWAAAVDQQPTIPPDGRVRSNSWVWLSMPDPSKDRPTTIEIADPRFREDLTRAARERGIFGKLWTGTGPLA